jgi:hypothetical protein
MLTFSVLSIAQANIQQLQALPYPDILSATGQDFPPPPLPPSTVYEQTVLRITRL